MDEAALRGVIEAAFEARDQVGPHTAGEIREAVEAALDGLDRGELRVAEKGPDGWTVHQWLKKAVLLSFRLNDMAGVEGGLGGGAWGGKGPSQVAGRGAKGVRRARVPA